MKDRQLSPAAGSSRTSSETFDIKRCLEQLGGTRLEVTRATRVFVDQFAPRFCAFLAARRVPNADAEEIVQDIMLRACVTQLSKLRRSDNPLAYLWRMLHNAHLDYLRTTKGDFRELTESRIGESVFLSIIHNVAGDDGDAPMREDYLRCVLNVLAKFRTAEPHRAFAIDLQAAEGMSSADLAEVLGKPSAGAAREYLSQARQALRELATAECGLPP